MDILEIEKNKRNYTRKLFNEMSTSHVKYEQAESYESLMNLINKKKASDFTCF